MLLCNRSLLALLLAVFISWKSSLFYWLYVLNLYFMPKAYIKRKDSKVLERLVFSQPLTKYTSYLFYECFTQTFVYSVI